MPRLLFLVCVATLASLPAVAPGAEEKADSPAEGRVEEETEASQSPVEDAEEMATESHSAGAAEAEQAVAEGEEALSSEELVAAWLKERLFTWDLWHTELARDLGENSLNDRADAARVLSALERLSACMDEPTKEALEQVAASYRKVSEAVATPGLPPFKVRQLAGTLDRLRSEVRRLARGDNVDPEAVRAEQKRKEELTRRVVPFRRYGGEQTREPWRARYVADERGELFHRINCPDAQQIYSKDRIYFRSRKEAEKAGYRPHQRCMFGE